MFPVTIISTLVVLLAVTRANRGRPAANWQVCYFAGFIISTLLEMFYRSFLNLSTYII